MPRPPRTRSMSRPQRTTPTASARSGSSWSRSWFTATTTRPASMGPRVVWTRPVCDGADRGARAGTRRRALEVRADGGRRGCAGRSAGRAGSTRRRPRRPGRTERPAARARAASSRSIPPVAGRGFEQGELVGVAGDDEGARLAQPEPGVAGEAQPERARGVGVLAARGRSARRCRGDRSCGRWRRAASVPRSITTTRCPRRTRGVARRPARRCPRRRRRRRMPRDFIGTPSASTSRCPRRPARSRGSSARSR